VAAAICAAGKHLITTHLHDNLGGGDPRRPTSKTDLHWCVGLGTINWPSVIQTLDAIGYRGPAMFEGTRIGPKGQVESDWQRGMSMAIANWRAWESLVAEMGGG